ncbi:MAG: hypothetical protein V4812_12045 [Pseudomonadota bacterium]
MSRLILAALAAMLLAGCSLHGPLHAPRPGSAPGPITGSVPATKPSTPGASHPRYAPPPGGNSRWDSTLGVYVLQGAEQLFYRERTYYRWNDGWSWSNSPQGPWKATDSGGVPASLGRHFKP